MEQSRDFAGFGQTANRSISALRTLDNAAGNVTASFMVIAPLGQSQTDPF
jgi:hypothetical protein